MFKEMHMGAKLTRDRLVDLLIILDVNLTD